MAILPRIDIRAVFNFSVAESCLGLLSFSLLKSPAHYQLKDTIEERQVFCLEASGLHCVHTFSGPPA